MVRSIQISGEKLRALRNDRLFFSQEELAAKLGMTKGNISRIEQSGGGMFLTSIRKLADLAHVTPEELASSLSPVASDAVVAKWSELMREFLQHVPLSAQRIVVEGLDKKLTATLRSLVPPAAPAPAPPAAARQARSSKLATPKRRVAG